MSASTQQLADDLLHRMDGERPPSVEELDRFHLLNAKAVAMRLEEGTRIMGEQTTCLRELRGSHVHMQGELKDLREIVMTKHARELEELRDDLNAVKVSLADAQSRLKWWAAGAAAVLAILSNINLGKLAELVR